MTMQRLHIREYTQNDIKSILNLFRVSFHKEVSGEWFRWKYQHSPWGTKGYVVVDDDAVVAFYGGIRLQFLFNGDRLWAYQFCDVMTHPGYRGRLLAGKTPFVIRIARKFHEDNPMEFAFGFPSERHARLQTMMIGGTSYSHVTVFKKELTPLDTPRLNPYRVVTGWTSIDKRDIDELWQRSSRRFSLTIVKNSNYIFWRYRNSPSGSYEVIAMKSRILRKVKAFAIIKTTGNELHVLDFFIPDKRVFAHFRDAMEYSAAKKGLGSVITWTNTNEDISQSLIASGYKSFQGIPFGVRIVDEKKIQEKEFYGRYCYRMGDYDAS
jgi:hypothetical protein